VAREPDLLQTYHMAGLPIAVTTPVDIARLLRELEQLEEFLVQASLRGAGTPVAVPRTSAHLDQLGQLNKLNLVSADDRQRLKLFLDAVKAQAPRLHVSFSADPPEAFIEKLMAWLRREIHGLVLITIGLQPNIGAGCVIRSTNKYFDLSLRQDFEKKRSLLRDAILATAGDMPAVAAMPAAIVPPSAPAAEQPIAPAPVLQPAETLA